MSFLTTALRINGKNFLSKRQLNIGFRLLIVFVLTAALYYELDGKKHLADIWATFLRRSSEAHFFWLFGILFLLPLNWLAEAAKWHPLVNKYEPMSRGRAFLAVMSGVTFALFTPNRVGEYGGRLLFVQPENHWKALIANVVGSIAQLIVLLTGGVIGATWFAAYYLHQEQWLMPAFAVAVLGLSLLYVMFFNIKAVLPWLKRLPFAGRLKRWGRNLRMLEQVERRQLAALLGWSAFRYLVYSTQYFFMLRFFDIETGIVAGYAGIATIFLLQTIIPLPAIAGLLVRGNLAVFVWSHFGANEISSLAATFMLWIINLILPALLGTFSLFYVRITKTLGYEKE